MKVPGAGAIGSGGCVAHAPGRWIVLRSEAAGTDDVPGKAAPAVDNLE